VRFWVRIRGWRLRRRGSSFVVRPLRAMTKSQIIFIGLCICAPAAFLLFYPVYRQSEPTAWALLNLGAAFGLVLFGWSLWSFRRHPLRAMIGLAICSYCFWQTLVIPGYVKAMQNHLASQWPNNSPEPTAVGALRSAVAGVILVRRRLIF
jgi:hypothetical protein